jgi:cyclic beta-1,2-glucan synthetase
MSNGRYHVLLSTAGGGQSRCRGLALNRWSADRVEDAQGQFIYLCDLDTGRFWSSGLQPVPRADATYDAAHEPARFSLACVHEGIESRLDVTVSIDDDLEIRRLALHNRSPRPRRLEVTSYLEVVLNYPAADAAHPAFSKLFVETEVVPDLTALLARRRPRANDESWPWMVHSLLGAHDVRWETDRLRFIGRGRTLHRPAALTAGAPLSGTVGPVLDPIFSLRATIDLAAGAETQLSFLTGMATDRQGAIAMLERYPGRPAIEHTFAAAAEAERALWRRLNISEEQAVTFQMLAGALWYAHPALRAPARRLTADVDVNAALDRFDIPRDRHLIVAERAWDDALLPELLTARRYWEAKGLPTTLVVAPEQAAQAVRPPHLDDGIVDLPAATVHAADRDAVVAAAHLVVHDSLLSVGVSEVVSSADGPEPAPTVTVPPADAEAGADSASSRLRFFNGYGGFSADGSEYVVRLPMRPEEPRRTPLPWINVVANERCGFLVSESGAGYTWSRNSQAHRLTPWSNDPVIDPHGEAVYIRDEDTGTLWSPLPGPAPASCLYEVRHGFGYSRFLCTNAGLEHDTIMFVPQHDPVRIVRLRLANRSARRRRVSVVSYCRLVMGSPLDVPSAIVTAHDRDHDILEARNPRGNEFRDGIAFSAVVADADVEARRFTCDRASFIGRNGRVSDPRALRPGLDLDDASGGGFDPCFAQQLRVSLAPGQIAQMAFLLGECTDPEAVRELVARYRQTGAVSRALEEMQDHWRSLVSTISVETPIPALDVMLNGWLVYQALSCRMLARSAFYQSGGAYGYRDQLQDAAALVHHRPALTRAQILLHASHQFVEGDVLHWWHPAPIERGLRTRVSDDLLWLPYVTSRYVRVTGDHGVLDEIVPFVTARSLQPGEDEAYLAPAVTDSAADVYEHCCRALDRSLTRGAHGLPLMGTGDWNDGMNRVGREGRGESVWLGFFLVHVIEGFLPFCERRGDGARVATYSAYRADLVAALNDAGGDGGWYRRAYYDDGTPLGSHTSDECRIDAIAQAWAVISGVAPRERAAQALDATEAMLVSERHAIIRLLTPPFVASAHDPGYIKGYVAGVRENGGQYTHGACWVVRAVAEFGRRDRAGQLLLMLLPTSHALTSEAADRYKLEPYVVAADIYSEPPHEGRGGWSWYTGSAGWLYRVALESILGFTVENGDTIRLRPRVPSAWPGYRITYRTGTGTVYEVEVTNAKGRAADVATVEVDGHSIECEEGEACIPLATDGRRHRVAVVLT